MSQLTQQQVSATTEAAKQCKAMTQMMIDALEKQKEDTAKHDQLVAEYQRRVGLYNASQVEYKSLCPGSCVAGGVQQYGCHPMCTNWARLNPLPQPVPDYVPPDLGTFVCSICSQVVDVSGIAGRDITVAENAIKQQQTCIANAEKQVTDQSAATQQGTGSATAEETKKMSSRTKMVIIFAAIFFFLIISTIIAILIIKGRDENEGAVTGGAM